MQPSASLVADDDNCVRCVTRPPLIGASTRFIVQLERLGEQIVGRLIIHFVGDHHALGLK